MKKKLLLILSLSFIFLIGSAVPANAMAIGNTDPGDMAVHLNHDFTSSAGSPFIDGALYTANGDIAIKTNPPSEDVFFHRTGTSFTYPDWFQWSYPSFQDQDYELDETAFHEKFPDLGAFPTVDNYIEKATNEDSDLTITQNAHYGTLKISSNSNHPFVINLEDQDICIIVDKLDITNWKTIDIVGNHTLYLYVEDCTGSQPLLLVNDRNDPDQVYIISHDYIPLNANYPLYGHVFYDGISSLNTNGYSSINGSIATDATSVSLSGSDPFEGLFYAPKAKVTMTGSSKITGRLVADSLDMSGNARIYYNEANTKLKIPNPVTDQKYTVRTAANPSEGGTVTPEATTVDSGDTVTIHATANAGYRFTGFTSSDSSMIPDSGGKITVTADVDITAHFEPVIITGDYVNGLVGEYYDARDFNNESALRMIRIDSDIAYNFMYGSPDEVIEPETFSIRWTGFIKPTVSGYYTFKTYSDDGVRISVNNMMVIDSWGALSLDYSIADQAVYLEAGSLYPITVEYQQLPIFAAVFLFWEADGVPMSVVPDSAFYVTASDYNSYVDPQYYNPVERDGKGFYNEFYTLDGNGDRAEEFSEINNIVYYWEDGAPGNITEDVFYGEMEGYLEAKFTETTTLEFRVDDGIKVWVSDENGDWLNDGDPVINKWNWNNGEVFRYSFDTAAGQKYRIRIKYIDKGFGASCVMRWKGDTLGDEDIPRSYMYTE